MSNIFNKDAQGHITGNYPLFLGEKRGLYDNIHVTHPRIFELYEDLKAIDWSHNELDLTQTKMDLLTCPPKTRDVMLLNLAYQWKADSAVGNSLSTLLQPFISNPEYAHCIAKIAENECLHALTYSNIARQTLDSPQEVFDLVYKTEKVLARSDMLIGALEDLDIAGCKYKLGLMSKDECRPIIFMGVMAIFILERLSFMNSFAATFALGQQQIFVGAAKYVQKICQDEMIHFEVGRYVCQDMLNDPLFKTVVDANMHTIEKMLLEAHAQEKSFNEYLFTEGRSVVGLNCNKLNQWNDYNMQNIYDSLKIALPFERVKEDPLPWIATDWVDLNAQQNANMESAPTNYQINSIVDDGTAITSDEFDWS